MITNEKQYKITNAQAEKFLGALNHFSTIPHPGSALIVKAQKEALASQYEDLRKQVEEYDLLKSGAIQITEARELEELPLILIKARIAQGLTQADLAQKLGLKQQQVQRYEADAYSSASFKRLGEIARVLNIQIKDRAEFSLGSNSQDIASAFPIKEMYERGWFTSFSGSLKQALSNAEDLLNEFFYASRMTERFQALHKKRVRSGGAINEFALYAWQARVVQRAFFSPVHTTFDPSIVTDGWLYSLVSLSKKSEGPLLAKEYLESYGIQVIVESHLDGTFLDGAAMFGADSNPIIAMTLRYDRIDNFWFVLLHELGHIVKHLFTGSSEFFDDLDVSSGTDVKEVEADEFAREALISSEKWARSPVRFFATESAIRKQAENWGISEAIVAGRVRRENKNWTSPELAKLVGQGKVRHLFEVG